MTGTGDFQQETLEYFGRTAMIVRFLRKTTDVTFEKSRALFDDVRWRAEDEGTVAKDDMWWRFFFFKSFKLATATFSDVVDRHVSEGDRKKE